MANSLLKLTVESSEYDAKLKKAAEGIRHLADVAHQGDGDLTGLEKSTLDYIKAVGEMETKSRSAAGQVRELESTYKELKVIYDQLNEVEKADEGGKALAASLEQLKQRAQEAKTQLDNASKSLQSNSDAGKDSSGILDALASKFTINIDAMKLFDVGLTAVNAALGVAKDAFFNNEEQLDEWGRVVESSHSLYNGFLNALNTGDISGYLNNIGQIVSAAREAYDALDALGTYNAFNQINIERTRTNMTESISDYRSGQGTKDAVKAAGEAYKKELRDRQRMENEAYLAAVKNMAAQRGVSQKDLLDAMSGTYGHYQDLKNVMPTGTETRYVPGLPGQAGRYDTYKVAQNDQERLGEALRHLNDTELQSLQALGAQAQRTATEVAQVDKQLTRVLNGKQPGSGSSGGSSKGGNTVTPPPVSGSIDEQTKKVQELQKAWRAAADDDSRRKIKAEIEEQKYALDRMMGNGLDQSKLKEVTGASSMATGVKGLTLPTTIDIASPMEKMKSQITGLQELQAKAWDPTHIEIYQKRIEELQGQMDEFSGKTTKGGKASSEAWRSASSAISTIGGAISQIEDPAAKILGTIGQAIATVAMAYSESLAKDKTTKGNIWAFIAAAAAATVSMATTIASIHSATGYASGGVVKGNSYSGDNIGGLVDGNQLVGLNSGEMVLNRFQQQALAGTLEGGGIKNISISGRLQGEDIVLSADRWGRRTGKGELLFAKNL